MHRSCFPKSVRLLKAAQFDRVMRRRFSESDGLIILYASQGESRATRVGLVVSRKCGNAVERNQWKRSIREAFRLVLHELPEGLDLVVLPRRGAAPSVARLQKSLRELTDRVQRRLVGAEPR